MTTLHMPQTQKIWTVARRGDPAHALQLNADASVPTTLGKGQILVKVQAAALNPVGYKLMQALPNFLEKRPHGAEFDLAGIVVDANGSNFQNGDEVFGIIPTAEVAKTGQGCLAEYTRLPAENVVIRPPNITPTEAAGLSLAGLTAYQALFTVTKLEPGQSVFVNGGSTAVGAFAIQLAKAVGCKVTASASGKNEAFVRSLGADDFIDYTKTPLHEYLTANPPTPKFHVIFEAVGLLDCSLFNHSAAYLAPSGIFISVGPSAGGLNVIGIAKYIWDLFLKPSALGGTKRTAKIVMLKFNPASLKHFTEYVAEGKVKPVVDSVYSFEDVLQAYARIKTGRATGKVVVKIDPNVV